MNFATMFGTASIRQKLMNIIMLTSVVSLLLAGAMFVSYEVVTSRQALVRDLKAIAEIAAANSAAAVEFNQPASASDTLRLLIAQPQIVHACLYTPEGTLFATYERAGQGDPFQPPPVGPDGHQFEGHDLMVFHPIRVAGARLGTLFLRADLEEIRARTRKHLFIFLGGFALCIVVAYLLSRKLQGVISRPILHLEETADAVARDRNYARRVERHGDDELGRLIDRFNAMLEQIQERDQALQKVHAELEIRVAERTRALELEVMERRHVQEEMLKAKEAAETANRAKSAFLATVSHEIRTPMNGVLGMTGLLLETPLTPLQRDYAETLHLSGEALLKIINDLLDFSKIEAGKLTFESVEFDLPHVLRNSVDLLAETARRKGLSLDLERGPDVPARLLGDPGRLRQVLMNLLGNALKFTEHGGIRLTVECLEESAHEAHLRFAIIDTGMGIPTALQETIFQPFIQADASMTRRYGGTGLGLAISRQLVEMMSGQLGLESRVGHGSTFWFTARLLKPLPSDAPRQAPTAAPPAPGLPRGHPCRVLVAEDNEVNQKVTLLQLRHAGFEGEVVPNGLAALEAVRRTTYDVILMDLQMPGMDGYETTRRIRAEFPHAGIYIVAMTANATAEDRAKCLAAGMDDFIAKPMLIEDLAATMARAQAKLVGESGPPLPDEEALAASSAATVQAATVENLRMLRGPGPGDVFVEIIDLFLDRTPGLIRELARAIRAADFAQAGQSAHRLKGSCQNVGAERMAMICARIEDLAPRGNAGALELAEEALEAEFVRAKTALEEAKRT